MAELFGVVNRDGQGVQADTDSDSTLCAVDLLEEVAVHLFHGIQLFRRDLSQLLPHVVFFGKLFKPQGGGRTFVAAKRVHVVDSRGSGQDGSQRGHQ